MTSEEAKTVFIHQVPVPNWKPDWAVSPDVHIYDIDSVDKEWNLVFKAEHSELDADYLVFFSIEDFECFLDLDNLKPFAEGIDWTDHANDIYERWRTGKTLYEVTVRRVFDDSLPF